MVEYPSDRIELYRQFISRFARPRWPDSNLPEPIPDSLISQLEIDFSVTFPTSLRLFLSCYGGAYVAELRDTWLHAGHQLSCPVPMDEFFDFETMHLENGTSWLAPIPKCIAKTADISSANAFDYLIAFAGDGGGNWFCFCKADCIANTDDLPVFYFDHDGGAIEKLACGLDDLIKMYLRLPARQL